MRCQISLLVLCSLCIPAFFCIAGAETVVEEPFDLDEPDTIEAAAPPKAPHGPGGPRGAPGKPRLSVVGDFTFEALLGGADSTEISFASNHSYVLLTLDASSFSRFTIELTRLVFWEYTIDLPRRSRIAFGRIAIPFGPLPFHQIYGGVVEKPLGGGEGEDILFPRDWAEYGIKGRIDLPSLTPLRYAPSVQAWISNGVTGYPELPDDGRGSVTFQAIDAWDNNNDKALGVRLENSIFSRFRLNGSLYTCIWSDPSADSTVSADRVVMSGIDGEIGFDALPSPVLRNLRWRASYAMARTRSSQPDALLPWHTKTATFLEATYRVARALDIQGRIGTYDDNASIVNGYDLLNFNIALFIRPGPGRIELIPRYMINRERADEKKDDYFLLKVSFML